MPLQKLEGSARSDNARAKRRVRVPE